MSCQICGNPRSRPVEGTMPGFDGEKLHVKGEFCEKDKRVLESGKVNP